MRGWIFSRRRREAELQEEIQFDLARETEENLRAGLDPAEARRAAQREFGNVTLAGEAAREVYDPERRSAIAGKLHGHFGKLPQGRRYREPAAAMASPKTISHAIYIGSAVGCGTGRLLSFTVMNGIRRSGGTGWGRNRVRRCPGDPRVNIRVHMCEPFGSPRHGRASNCKVCQPLAHGH